MPHTDIMAPPSATRAEDAASPTPATVLATKKSKASATTKELPPTQREETDNSVVTPLPTVDLSSLEGGPSFSLSTNTKNTTKNDTATTPQVKAGNIPRKHVPAPIAPVAAVQPFRFGQPAQPTGIRYPPGFNPSTVVARPQRPVRAENTAASPPFVPAAPPSALSPPPISSPPSLPVPNSREFTFNAKSSSGTVSPPITPSFPDSTEVAKTMFLTASHRKRNMAMTPAVSEYEADLTSKDRMKQKEAVKKILAAKVRSDWAENWVNEFPPVQKVLETVGEDEQEPKLRGDGEIEEKWVERSEWLSELSSSEDEGETPASPPLVRVPTTEERPSFLRRLSSSGKAHADPFRFENPDSVGEVLKSKTERKKVRRQRRFVDELKENEGLRCFTARRNIWTGAKIVRRPVTSRPTSKASASGSAKVVEELPKVEESNGEAAEVAAEPTNGTSTSPEAAKEEQEKDEWDDVILDTLIPIPQPLLPPSTPMRKNVTSRNHTTIYDKIILGGQTPLCPINLQTVVSSCVEGWKRDGEWPPRLTVENDALMSRKKVVGEAKKPRDGGPGWRRSLQKVFGGRADGPI